GSAGSRERWPRPAPTARASAAREPEAELASRRLGRVGAVHEVLLHLETPVAPPVAADGAGRRACRIGRAGEGAEALDDPVARDAHRHDGPRLHELDERLIERLALVLLVVRGEQLAVGLQQADVDELVALRLDAAQDLAGEAAGDTIRLHDHEGLFDVGHGVSPSGEVAGEGVPDVWAASQAAFWRSIWRPRTKQYTQRARKAAPTRNIIGSSRPVAMIASCST